LKDLCFIAEAGKPQFSNVLKWPQSTRLRQHPACSQILELSHISKFGVTAQLYSTDQWLWFHDIRIFSS
jgi:hypothetical protein